MLIIDAFWEKRNLDVEAKEIVLSDSDSLSDIEDTLNSLPSENQYIVANL